MISNFFNTVLATFKTFQIKDAVDIIIVALIIFYLFRIIRQTRSAQLLKGLAVLLIAYLLSAIFNLTMMNSILKMIFEFAVIIIVVIFQPEIRKILERIGKQKFTKTSFINFVSNGIDNNVNKTNQAITDVCDSCVIFSRNKIGALIVFERETLLTEIAESGTILNSETSVSILSNIFYKGAPLHDGACIIRQGYLYSAGCILPLTYRNDLASHYGTRHRAAVGISEESDAVVVVVSEETGSISLVVRGNIERDMTRLDLYNKLNELIVVEPQNNTTIFSTIFKSGKESED